MPLLAAVDVGTGSARAGIFDATGRLLARAEQPIETNAPAPGHAEQDSTQIWRAACTALKTARAEAAARPEQIAGLAFDATCSLVLRDAQDRPVTVSTTGDDRWDTLLWIDHRAIPEAEACTATGNPALASVGGAMSPEMQLPKLMWLKRHLPETWSRTALAFDLADFLAWTATGTPARSLCTLACKWNYRPEQTPAWPADFLDEIGLADLLSRTGLPETATRVATDLGPVTAAAARDLGLTPETRVATGLIDAHAGALGVLGHLAAAPDLASHLALIAGTSSCLMQLSRTPRVLPGIWGPHRDAILPGLWLGEGGQSASGALLDHLLRLHGLAPTPTEHARVIARIGDLRAADPDLAPRLHVLPDFHGSRSPHPDPRALGVVSGLPLDASFDALCRLYWRTCVAIALGLRAILDHLEAHGVPVTTLHAAGGHTRNPLLMQLYPDVTGRPTIEPHAPDAVLLGTAMVAATGIGLHPSLAAAAAAMHQGGSLHAPDPAGAAGAERDRRAFAAMLRHRAELDALDRPNSVANPGALRHRPGNDNREETQPMAFMLKIRWDIAPGRTADFRTNQEALCKVMLEHPGVITYHAEYPEESVSEWVEIYANDAAFRAHVENHKGKAPLEGVVAACDKITTRCFGNPDAATRKTLEGFATTYHDTAGEAFVLNPRADRDSLV